MEKMRVIAAVRNKAEFSVAIETKTEIIFVLTPNIAELKNQAEQVHKAGKKMFIHIDLAEGIGKDEHGIRFAKEQGVDGIISTRTNMIKTAKKIGMFTVQRFFVVDSQSVATAVESAKASKADMVEIMPGVVPKVIKKLQEELDVPIVAGGLIETKKEIRDAIDCGAIAISTGKREFWGMCDE